MQQLEDRVAVVTGGASGIGLALAERFARAGMKLVLADIEAAPLEATARELVAQGARVATRITDVSAADDVEGLRDVALDAFGAVHVVCNNAGVAGGFGPAWTLSEKDWTYTLGPNLWGVIHGVRIFTPLLVAQGEGHIVNTASMAGLVSGANMAAYNVTKQGVVALSETLFEDLRNAGSEVGVSVLCPAFVRTRIWDAERNRPEALRNPVRAGETSTPAPEGLKAIIEGGMEAGRVADAVHDAILAKQLYVLTHPATGRHLQRRVETILSGRNPSPPDASLGSLQQPD
jgi:NAD(P)-dependent dehydrogenase (short-subunit alcohol dehydrogenase family)